LNSGDILSVLASAYASLIVSSFPSFDVLFGPAYKGIALAGAAAVALHKEHNVTVGYAYNRKEAKSHGEGGWHVGAPIKGKKVLILDDVMTAGTAVREAIDGVKKEGGEVIGVVLCLDRQEVGGRGTGKSTVEELEEELGEGKKVRAVIGMKDLMAWLEKEGHAEELERMKEYWERYCVKG
jgi:orotate phosphoribosyltransferase